MYQNLKDVLNGKEENYLLPFYWQKGDHRAKIPAQIDEIYRSGCRALCVESRPHNDFAGPGWWADMDIILDECKKRDMKVWILDDDHFPTGHANGKVKADHPELLAWHMLERHADVIGPMKDASYYIKPFAEGDVLIGAYLYKRADCKEEIFTGEYIEVTDQSKNNLLTFDVPEGTWRIVTLFRTQTYAQDAIDMFRPESVRVLIDEVYETHYQHYADEFGKTISGFFSDEPAFRNNAVEKTPEPKLFYNHTVGEPGLCMPWSDKLFQRMERKLGIADVKPRILALWYKWLDGGENIRLAYMDTLTDLYRTSFTMQLGDWCRAHNVLYIGHVIEDMNSHARMYGSSGHFFRALEGQDMSGMDIVLQQVLPGFGHYMNVASCSGGVVDPHFFHYVLGQLCVSDANTDERKMGRAMCEVFGAFGWAEGSPFMKWLMDFLLVRGINRFVPHAFSPCYPNTDCPPHFGAEGHDPQFDGFTALMKYTNKAAHLLSGTVRKATAAILYHAEGEWMNGIADNMYMQVPAVNLLDNQINYDILSADLLEKATVSDGKLSICRQKYDCLILPWTKLLSASIAKRVSELKAAGLPVICTDKTPDNYNDFTAVVPADEMSAYLRKQKFFDITTDKKFDFLRFYHGVTESDHVFMFSNESLTDIADLTVTLPVSGNYTRLDLLGGKTDGGIAENGILPLSLAPYCSEIYVFDGTFCEKKKDEFFPEFTEPKLTWKLFKADHTDLSDFKDAGMLENLVNFNVTEPDFSGKLLYKTEFESDGGTYRIDLGTASQTAQVKLNGSDLGIRICPPYTFDTELLNGNNTLEVTVANTLVNVNHDGFSDKMIIPPTGLLGPVRFFKKIGSSPKSVTR